MPWNVVTDGGKRTEREILAFPVGLGAIRSVVIKASSVTPRSVPDVTGFANAYDNRHARTLLRGQLLTKDTVDPTKYIPYTGSAGQTCTGILDNDVEFIDGTSNSDEAANMLFFGCIFKAANLIGYTGNETAVKAALPTCRFE